MMHALRAQLFEGERLFVVYQPADMLTGKTVEQEALLALAYRGWTVYPSTNLFPIAEYSGLIVNIGEWVLQ